MPFQSVPFRLIVACLHALLAAVLAAQDPREIMRRSVERDTSNSEIARNYTFLQRQEQRELDSSGKVRHVESTTTDVTLQEGSPYFRLVARNDQPLSSKEREKEEDKLQKSIEQRRRETPEQRQRRIEDWERRVERRRGPLKEIPDAFDFKLVDQEVLNGIETYVIDATPKPGYRPKTRAGIFFPKIKARFWIDKTDYQWVKTDIDVRDTITFGGVLLRIAKGGNLTLEQTRVNNEVWLPKSITGRGKMRIALVKVLRGELNVTFSGYKKFQTDSRIVPVVNGRDLTAH